MEMKALSLWQPWPYCIFHEGKDVENRRWWTPYRGILVIHAGKKFDGTPLGEIEKNLPRGAYVGYVKLQDCATNVYSSWAAHGQYHWVITDPVEFETPIPGRGQLGLWTPPKEVITAVIELEEGR